MCLDELLTLPKAVDFFLASGQSLPPDYQCLSVSTKTLVMLTSHLRKCVCVYVYVNVRKKNNQMRSNSFFRYCIFSVANMLTQNNYCEIITFCNLGV